MHVDDRRKRTRHIWLSFVVGVLMGSAITTIAFLWVGSGRNEKVIRVLGEDSANTRALQELATDYERQTGVRVEFVVTTFDELMQKSNQDLVAGTGSYDIILNYNFALSPYVRNGWVWTLPELREEFGGGQSLKFESEIFPNAWTEVASYYADPTSGEGMQRISYPASANTMLLVYNREMFENPRAKTRYQEQYHRDLTLPTTWQQFRDVAEFFTSAEERTYGVVLTGAEFHLYYEWINFAFGMGGGVMEKEHGWQGDLDTPVTVDSPETIAATEFYIGLKPFNAGDFFSTGQIEQRSRMAEGSVAMAIVWSDIATPVLANEANRSRFGWAPIPGDVSMQAGGAFYINKKTKVPNEAFDLMCYFLQPPMQVQLMRRGLNSPLRSTFEDPGVESLVFASALRRSLDRAVYMMEAGPDSTAIQQVLENYLQRMWKGDISVPEGLRTAQNEISQKRSEVFEQLEKVRSIQK